MEKIKLHGAFRSGTNYAKALLELNYDVQVVATHGGWKHAPVPALFGRAHSWPILGVVREPWSWLLAMWDYVQGLGGRHITCGTTWQTFLTESMTITHGGDDGVPNFRYAGPVDYWNAMAANLTSLSTGAATVRYEDLLDPPEAAVATLGDKFGLTRTSVDGFVTVERLARNMVDRPRCHLDQYVTEEMFQPRPSGAEARDRFSWRDRRTVTKRLDGVLLQSFGA